ncbi:MAG: hypothetical protein AB2A00_00305 [Myxococcota bacterium]
MVDDSVVATRALRGAAGLMDAATATGVLHLRSLASLLPTLGLAGNDDERRALYHALKLPMDATVNQVAPLPWPGAPRLQGRTLLVHGAVEQTDAALRLAAGCALGLVPAEMGFTPTTSGQEAALLSAAVERLEDPASPVLLVVGPPRLTADLLSPVVRDLQPVLKTMADRRGLSAATTGDVGYELLSMLDGEAGLVDERVENEARAGVHTLPGGAAVVVGEVDGDAVDERVASSLKGAGGVVLCVEPAVVGPLLPALASRLKAVLVLAGAQMHAGVVSELPARMVMADSGYVVGGMLESASIQSRELPNELAVQVGETAVAAPSPLLAGAARRACGEGKAAVTDGATGLAVVALNHALDEGALAGGCKLSLALFPRERRDVGRAVAATFLRQNLGAARSSGGARKVRIKG